MSKGRRANAQDTMGTYVLALIMVPMDVQEEGRSVQDRRGHVCARSFWVSVDVEEEGERAPRTGEARMCSLTSWASADV